MFSHHSAHAHRPTFITSTPSNTGLAHHYAHAHGVCPLGKLESYLIQHHTLAWMEYRTPSSWCTCICCTSTTTTPHNAGLSHYSAHALCRKPV